MPIKVVRKNTSPYKTGPKGVSVGQAHCSQNGYALIVSETVGLPGVVCVSFSSSAVVEVKTIEEGIDVARAIFKKQTKPYYPDMAKIAEKHLKKMGRA